MAHALTSVRLLLVVPVAVMLARPQLLPPTVLLTSLGVAIATDYFDGRVARARGVASARGQLFDHTTDFIFVTTGLYGASHAGMVPVLLPLVIPVAFGQYVLDSYVLSRSKQLRVSTIGRWNGILYYVPLVLMATGRVGWIGSLAPALGMTTTLLCYGLVVSTMVSIIDRAAAPLR